MKSKFGLILKTHLSHAYKLKRMTSKKLLLFLGLFFYVAVSIFMMLREFFDNIYKMLLEMNFVSTYFVILFLIASLFSFFYIFLVLKIHCLKIRIMIYYLVYLFLGKQFYLQGY